MIHLPFVLTRDSCRGWPYISFGEYITLFRTFRTCASRPGTERMARMGVYSSWLSSWIGGLGVRWAYVIRSPTYTRLLCPQREEGVGGVMDRGHATHRWVGDSKLGSRRLGKGCVEDLDIRCERLAVRLTCFGVAVQDFVYIPCCMY